MDARRLMALAATFAAGLLSAGCTPDLPTFSIPGPTPPEAEPDPYVGQPVIAFVSSRSGSPYVYVTTADGIGVRRLARGQDPAWSWDGRWIAFTRGVTNRGPAGIYKMDVNGQNLRYLGPGDDPTWSPDGRITFSTTTWTQEEAGIAIMSASGSDAHLLVAHSAVTPSDPDPYDYYGYSYGGVSNAIWSPDGSKVAFMAYLGYYSGSRVYVMNADGSGSRDLGGWPAIRGSSWSPDGTTIASIANGTIYLQDAVSGTLTLVDIDVPTGWMDEGGADWSADGAQLLFDAIGPPGSGRPRRIFGVSVATGQVGSLLPEVTNRFYEDYDATWSRGPQ